MSLLSAREAEEVEKAIGRAEAQSAGEVVVAVLRQSADYALVRGLTSMAWTIAVMLASLFFFPKLPQVWRLIFQLPIYGLLWWVTGLSWLLRRLVGHEFLLHSVKARAFQLFAERGVHQTRNQSGLLILISELEHHVVIFGDSGIHQHLGAAGWQTHIERIVTGIKTKTLGVTLVSVIDQLGKTLAAKFPPRSPSDDINELPNEIVRD